MAIALLDLADSNLQLWHDNTRLQSPGYALLEGNDYVFGLPARASARLKPRDINTRFWWQLGTEALQPALGPARHTADLAHAHLNALHRDGGQPGEILIAVPGTMQREQLSLLLGIAQQCPFNPVGLVNRSALLASLHGGFSRIYHLELQLHQSAVSTVAIDSGQCHLERAQALPGCGLLQLQERLVEAVASAFVRQARFDPRRQAENEQQLYDALPGLLQHLAREDECNIDTGGYQARISRSDLAECAQRLEQSAAQAIGQVEPGELLLLDPVLALLPGLKSRLGTAQALDAEDVQWALQAHGNALVQRGEALHLVNDLPLANPETRSPQGQAITQPEARPAVNAGTPATHWLQGHSATALNPAGTPLAAGWQLRQSASGWQLEGSGTAPLVNGQSYTEGQPLVAGDEIRIGNDFVARLIEVEG